MNIAISESIFSQDLSLKQLATLATNGDTEGVLPQNSSFMTQDFEVILPYRIRFIAFKSF